MNSSIKAPIWFLIIAILAVLWNAMGVMAYISMAFMSNEDFLKLPEIQQTLQNAMPSWAKAAFAIAVFAGFLGCLLLVFKKSIAVLTLVLSLVAVLVQQFNFIFLQNGFDYVDSSAKSMTIMIVVVAFLLVWLAQHAKSKLWIT